MKKVLLLILFLVVPIWFFAPAKAYADSESSSGYKIRAYDITMNVNQNNSLDITEHITVRFTESRHGIDRDLPKINRIKRQDGSYALTYAVISGFHVTSPENTPFTVSETGANEKFRIGRSDVYANPDTDYCLSYHYDLGEDNNPNFDELYYNLIGTGWDTNISKVSFKIVMPKAFDQSKLGFSCGKESSIGAENLKYSVDGNEITGMLYKTLTPGEALTVRLQLPEGYFTGERANDNHSVYFIIMLLFVAAAAAAFLIWFKFGRDKKVVPTVEFNPPGEYNSAEVQFLRDGKVDMTGIVSLIVHLATKGYLKIRDLGESPLHHKHDFILEKVKDYDGANTSENILFSNLFHGTTEATRVDLQECLHNCTDKIEQTIASKENRNLIFEKNSFSGKTVILILGFLTLLAAHIPCFLLNAAIVDMILFCFVIIGLVVLYSTVIHYMTSFSKIKKYFISVLTCLLLAFGFIIAPYLQILADLKNSFDLVPALLPYYVVGMVCSAVIFFFYCIALKRTETGTLLLGKVLGYQKFLETAEKDTLEAEVEKNPESFYDVLPYAYALGVSDAWVDKFRFFDMPAPQWYSSDYDSDFSINDFDNSFSSVMDEIVSDNSTGGGGSSGGGSSGGGSGGGGGDSW